MRHEPTFSQEATERGYMLKIAVAQNAVNLCQETTDAAKIKSDASYLETLPALRAAKNRLLQVEGQMRKAMGIKMPVLERLQ